MYPLPAMIRAIAPCLLILAVLFAGCTGMEPAVTGTGSVEVTSSPPGAEIYFDNEYRGTTPATISSAPEGAHSLEVREPGYERFAETVNVTPGETARIAAVLTKIPETMPVTVRTTATPAVKAGTPQIHVDGYWTYPPSPDMENPVTLIVHTEGFNVGTTDARIVTVNAMLTYQGRTICWDKVYLGSLRAGGHVATDTMISCSLPSGFKSSDLSVRYQTLEATL